MGKSIIKNLTGNFFLVENRFKNLTKIPEGESWIQITAKILLRSYLWFSLCFTLKTLSNAPVYVELILSQIIQIFIPQRFFFLFKNYFLNFNSTCFFFFCFGTILFYKTSSFLHIFSRNKVLNANLHF